MALTQSPAAGATPLSAEDVRGLRLPFVRTRGQLDEVEAQNILAAKQWALRSRLMRVPQLLSMESLQRLHARMFGEVWTWAGAIRTADLQNAFAAAPSDIRVQWRLLHDDAVQFWLQDPHMDPDDCAVRVHHRLVKTHLFPNGNGRHARLVADLMLERHFRRPPFTWGGPARLGNSDPYRPRYLEALRAADANDYAPLRVLCRADGALELR